MSSSDDNQQGLQASTPQQIRKSRTLDPVQKGKRALVAPNSPSPKFSSTVLVGLRDHISCLIGREQHGFVAGRSCATQLTSASYYIGRQLDACKQIDIINLDICKAFDKVDHVQLLGRLHRYDITGKLHDCFRSY